MNTHTEEKESKKVHHESTMKSDVDVIVEEVPICTFNKKQIIKYGAIAIVASVAIGSGAALATPAIAAYFAPAPLTGLAALWAKVKFF